ncbi:MAG: hypothetical protein IKB04_05410 [Clostridia bacterium]|nr:hypothetical protein [Clostridia bacterium]
MQEIYNYIFIGGLVLAIVMLIATVLIFFLLNIRGVIGDITGTNKRRAVENIHNKSSIAGNNKKHATKVDYSNKTTSARLDYETKETTKISAQDRYDSMEASETTTLNATASETTVLSAAEAMAAVQAAPAVADGTFQVECDITYTHSSEIIV